MVHAEDMVGIIYIKLNELIAPKGESFQVFVSERRNVGMESRMERRYETLPCLKACTWLCRREMVKEIRTTFL